MKAIKILSFLCLIQCYLFGQDIEILGGLNINNYYDFQTKNSKYHTEYKDGNGIHIGVGFRGVRIKNQENEIIGINLYLIYDNYSGAVKTFKEIGNGGRLTEFSTQKHILSFGIYAPEIKLLQKKLRFSFGPEIRFLLGDKINGSLKSISETSQLLLELYNEDIKGFSNPVTLGLSFKFGYLININNQFMLQPQYNISIGVTNEFKEYRPPVQSMIHRFSIGIIRKFE